MIKLFLKNKSVFLIAILSSLFSIGSAEYYISLCVNNAAHQKVVFTAYYGLQSYILDSAILDAKGNIVFQNKEKSLVPGLYSFIFSSQQRLDFIINKEQNFTLSTDISNLSEHLQIDGSAEISLFADYERMVNKFLERESFLTRSLKNAGADSVSYFQSQIKKSQNELREYRAKVVLDNPNTVLALYVNLAIEPQVPALVKRDSLSLLKAFSEKYKSFVTDYFENIDFSNETYIRIPQFAERLSYFFNRLIIQNPDTIKLQIDRVLNRCENEKEMYRFVLRFLFQNYYERFDEKIYETTFIYLVDEYYKKGKADWAKDQFIKLLADRVNMMRPTLYGAKAPELKLQSPDGKKITLSQIKAPYIILYFYEYDCGRCKVETPKLLEVYKKYKGKVEVVAVYMHADKVRWEQYIEENKLKWINVHDPAKNNNIKEIYFIQRVPTLFLLDKDKRIIEKKISVDVLDARLRELVR